MKKKLTLMVDEQVIDMAKRYARANDSSVSEIVEHYFIEHASDQQWMPEPGSILSKIAGTLVSKDKGLSDQERLVQAIRQKHA